MVIPRFGLVGQFLRVIMQPKSIFRIPPVGSEWDCLCVVVADEDEFKSRGRYAHLNGPEKEDEGAGICGCAVKNKETF